MKVLKMVKGNAIVVIVCGTADDGKWVFFTEGKLRDYAHYNRVMVGKVLIRLLQREFKEKVEVAR